MRAKGYWLGVVPFGTALLILGKWLMLNRATLGYGVEIWAILCVVVGGNLMLDIGLSMYQKNNKLSEVTKGAIYMVQTTLLLLIVAT